DQARGEQVDAGRRPQPRRPQADEAEEQVHEVVEHRDLEDPEQLGAGVVAGEGHVVDVGRDAGDEPQDPDEDEDGAEGERPVLGEGVDPGRTGVPAGVRGGHGSYLHVAGRRVRRTAPAPRSLPPMAAVTQPSWAGREGPATVRPCRRACGPWSSPPPIPRRWPGSGRWRRAGRPRPTGPAWWWSRRPRAATSRGSRSCSSRTPTPRWARTACTS